MKKLTALLMILTLSVFSIGCGGGDDSAPAPTPPADGGADDAPADDADPNAEVE